MGIVYRAADAALARDVAVKVLHPRFPPDSAASARFVEEVRITGQLQHPGIPAVHDLGTLPDGRPFLAMKLIKGRTLADLLKERPDPSADRGRFVAVFEAICQAVAYAHAHGVIHRDLKAHNVMVGAFGEVQVMDWGIAKVLAEGGGPDAPPASGTAIRSPRGADAVTEAGTVLGTPNYMAPEQAIGAVDQIDRRSDVFGLGGILCAILTGAPPFRGADPEATRQRAARARLDDALGRLDVCGAEPELVDLCKRCLSPEQADRPADAGAVADAVRRLRAAAEDRARQAELDRAKAEVQAAEQRRRRRIQFALFAAVGVIVLGGGAIGWWADRQAAAREGRNAQAIDALLGLCEEHLRADDAEKAGVPLEEAERRAKEGGAASQADRLARCRADLDTLRDIDRTEALFFTVVDGRFRGSRAAEWAEVFARFGIRFGETPPEEAARRVNESLIRERILQALDSRLGWQRSPAILAILRVADPNPYRDEVRAAMAANNNDRLRELADRPEALAQPARFAVTLGSYRPIPRARQEEILRTALQRRPGDHLILLTIGQLALDQRKSAPAEAAVWYRAALAVRPGNAGAWNNLGIALKDQGDLAGAEAAYREAIRLDPKYADAHHNLGGTLRKLNRAAEAEAEYREAIRLGTKVPDAYLNLGLALYRKGEFGEAIVRYHDALKIDPKFSAAHNNLGNALRKKGDLPGAVAAYRKAIEHDRKNALAWGNLGHTLIDTKQPAEALAAFREAVRLGVEDAGAHYQVGVDLLQKGDAAGAETAFRAAVRFDPKNAGAHSNLGMALSLTGDTDGAIAALREALRLDPQSAEGHMNLGSLLGRQGRFAEALEHLKKAHEIGSKRPDWRQPTAQLVRMTENFVAVDARLTEVLAGRAAPRGVSDLLEFALICRLHHRRYADAARFYAGAFAADGRVAEQFQQRRRAAAAEAAAAASAGRGVNPPPEADRPALRKQALAWLSADLAAWRQVLAASGPRAAPAVHAAMRAWLAEPCFGPVRHRLHLAALPPAEAAEWLALWAEVRDLRDRTAPIPVAPPPRPIER
jgi:tetratricopeptide (TPR) repeat protein